MCAEEKTPRLDRDRPFQRCEGVPPAQAQVPAYARVASFDSVWRPTRERSLQAGDGARGDVVYWMSREQRVHDNWALLRAAQLARERGGALTVAFCLRRGFLNAPARGYDFMLPGLEELERDLAVLSRAGVLCFDTERGVPSRRRTQASAHIYRSGCFLVWVLARAPPNSCSSSSRPRFFPFVQVERSGLRQALGVPFELVRAEAADMVTSPPHAAWGLI